MTMAMYCEILGNLLPSVRALKMGRDSVRNKSSHSPDLNPIHSPDLNPII